MSTITPHYRSVQQLLQSQSFSIDEYQNTVLLAPLSTTDDEETVRRKLAGTATYLDIWLMRRAANYVRVGYSSTAYAMFLLCRDIRRRAA